MFKFQKNAKTKTILKRKTFELENYSKKCSSICLSLSLKKVTKKYKIKLKHGEQTTGQEQTGADRCRQEQTGADRSRDRRTFRRLQCEVIILRQKKKYFLKVCNKNTTLM
ncbi:hypothetical protein NL108_017390 [Boleophthalmus pectinirostris]|nr:hypothetical protein NL108_017390 [Boleophthalmus pectinirostris]